MASRKASSSKFQTVLQNPKIQGDTLHTEGATPNHQLITGSECHHHPSKSMAVSATFVHFVVSRTVRAAILETEPLPPQGHKSGTVCRPCSIRLCGLSFGQFRRLLKATAQCKLFLTVLNTNILTYLLTYLLTYFSLAHIATQNRGRCCN